MIKMELLTADKPKNLDCLNTTRNIFSVSAKDIFLWILYCLYKPVQKFGFVVDHIEDLSNNRGFFGKHEVKLLDGVRLHGLQELQKFDIVLLHKIVIETCDLKGHKEGSVLHGIRTKLDYILQTRNKFCHDDITLINLDEGEFKKRMKTLQSYAKFLIEESGKLGRKRDSEIRCQTKIIRDSISHLWEKYEKIKRIDDTISTSNSTKSKDDANSQTEIRLQDEHISLIDLDAEADTPMEESEAEEQNEEEKCENKTNENNNINLVVDEVDESEREEITEISKIASLLIN